MNEVSFGGNIYLDEESRKQIAEIVKRAAEKQRERADKDRKRLQIMRKICRMESERIQADPKTEPWKRYALRSIDVITDIRETFNRLFIQNDERAEDAKEAAYRDVAEYVELVLAGVQSFIEAHTQKYGPEAVQKNEA